MEGAAGNVVDLVSEARKRDFKKALSQVPRFDGTTPWRLWKMEFALWLRVYEVREEEAAKLALLTSMRGAAVQKIAPYGCGTTTWDRCITFESYLAQVEQIFAPPAESDLAKIEFSTRVQGKYETVTSYLAAKFSLYEMSFAPGEQSEPTLITATINGLYSNVIKRMTRRGNPIDRVQLQTMVIQAVANERSSYHDGYSESTNLDGLGATTVSLTREMGGNDNRDEPMDISAMERDSRCFRCKKLGHLRQDCRVKLPMGEDKPTTGEPRPGSSRNPGQLEPRLVNARNSGQFRCYNCGKEGHISRDCRQPKKRQLQPDGVRVLDEEYDEEEEYHFLEAGPEADGPLQW